MKFIILAILFSASLSMACSYCKSAGANLPKTNAATEAANAAKGGGGVVMRVVAPKSSLSGDEFFKSVDGKADDDDTQGSSRGKGRESEITYTNAYQDQ